MLTWACSDGHPTPQGQTIIKQELTQAQRAFIVTITDGLDAINSAQTNLNQRSDLPHLGDDPVSFIVS